MYYISLWVFVLLLVHVQFKYCRPITLCALKCLEAFIIVGFIELYRETNGMDFQTIYSSLSLNTTFIHLAETWQLFRNSSSEL